MPHNTLAVVADLVHRASNHPFWLIMAGMGAVAVACLFLGFSWLHRARMIADLPTSKTRSAAQGYVELEGWARMMKGEPVYAPLSGVPCAWYSFEVEQQDRDAEGRSGVWRTIEKGVSEAIFHLQDETGFCIVDPDGADVTPSVRLCWRGQIARPGFAPRESGFWSQLFSFGPYRYTECRIQENDRLYAAGQFVSSGGGDSTSLGEETRDLLSAWKRDRAGLSKRFDTNRDGNIDLQEWEIARQAAEREVIATLGERRQEQPEFNLMKKPAYGRPFILSCIPQEAIIARYRRRAFLGIVAFLMLGAALTWAVDTRLGWRDNAQPTKTLK
ncbi:MAG TPA: GIDE domain-containing protein [Methylococcaceae bacterium]|jgi:hypothetical protein|nr:GIDE domain-containing protein [Methylococcaceae bacterium]